MIKEMSNLYKLYNYMNKELDKIQSFVDDSEETNENVDWQIKETRQNSYEKLREIEYYIRTNCKKFSNESINAFFESCHNKTKGKIKTVEKHGWNEWDKQDSKYIILDNLFHNVLVVLKKKIDNYEFMLFGRVK